MRRSAAHRTIPIGLVQSKKGYVATGSCFIGTPEDKTLSKKAPDIRSQLGHSSLAMRTDEIRASDRRGSIAIRLHDYWQQSDGRHAAMDGRVTAGCAAATRNPSL